MARDKHYQQRQAEAAPPAMPKAEPAEVVDDGVDAKLGLESVDSAVATKVDVEVAASVPEPMTPAKARAKGPPHHTLCRVDTLGTVVATAMTQDGAQRSSWSSGEVAWFSDADVMSLPGILTSLE